jgi:hypothetical protein
VIENVIYRQTVLMVATALPLMMIFPISRAIFGAIWDVLGGVPSIPAYF